MNPANELIDTQRGESHSMVAIREGPATQSDALLFFGATVDLAYKKIFRALQAKAKHGNLNVPVIGVARSAPDFAALKARARESVEKHGGLGPAVFDKLVGLLRYVRGDNSDPATYKALRRELGDARHPAYYLAIPPTAFATVVEHSVLRGEPCNGNADPR
jgi:glucose-6-phosphate 1-dehydrogenase